MRLRRVQGAAEKIESSNYVIKNPKDYKGQFTNVFKNNNPIYIEIGMGKGKFIVENAKKYPNVNFIGIEKFDSVLVRAIEKVEEEEIPNLRFIRIDAKEIEEVFFKEVDKVYLNFSDPWPKDRHAKRRLTSPEFLKRYDIIFKDKKEIEMKTDNRKLFEYSVISLTNYQYEIANISFDLHSDQKKDNIMTEYEEKFSSRGQVIYFINVFK